MVKYAWAQILVAALAAGGATVASTQGAPATLRPAPPENQERRITELIAQLGDADYFVRQRAQAELTRIGSAAYDAMLDATAHEDLEIAARAKYLLRLIRVEWSLESDPPEVKRLLGDYELKDLDERRRRIQILAELPGKAGAGPLCRLVRYEQAEELSKWAAVELLAMQPLGQPLDPQWRQIIATGMGGSRRVAARWLLAYAKLHERPAETLAEWAQLTAAEQLVLRRAPHQSDPRILSALLRLQVAVLEKLRRIDDALAVMQRLIQLERGDLSSLVELVEWLVDKKAWKLVDEAAARFASRFALFPMLAYLQAEAQLGRGDRPAAEATIAKARETYGGQVDTAFRMHLVTANRLFRRGKYAWAEQEFRDVIEKAGPRSAHAPLAYLGLSELLHDQAQDTRAADTLQELCDKVLKRKGNDDVLTEEHKVGEFRARMHFYRSCVARERGDLAAERSALLQAFAAWPTEIDVLIACYRLPAPDPEFQKKVREAIRKAAAEIREQIAAAPQDAVFYNQLAWLVANTEGDLDEALKFSKLSIELNPGNGGFYDTLARVYYARGDYPSAIAHQSKAAELEPHHGLIRRQLEFFKKEQARRSTSGKP